MFKGNVCCVDVSYLTFYRFFALRKWYGFAHKDDESVKEKDYKWLNNKLFMEKFIKYTFSYSVFTFVFSNIYIFSF